MGPCFGRKRQNGRADRRELSAPAAAVYAGLLAVCILWGGLVVAAYVKEAEERCYPLPRSFVMHNHRISMDTVGDGWYLPSVAKQDVVINS